ncbi:MAG: hypothetical protein RLZZ495_993, partial [Pseudomonadota bacterium]
AQFFDDCRRLGLQTLTAAQAKELLHADY